MLPEGSPQLAQHRGSSAAFSSGRRSGVPSPFFNDIFAMASPLHGYLQIDGDAKVPWQNVRALTWMLS
jgi:hypothetical protein